MCVELGCADQLVAGGQWLVVSDGGWWLVGGWLLIISGCGCGGWWLVASGWWWLEAIEIAGSRQAGRAGQAGHVGRPEQTGREMGVGWGGRSRQGGESGLPVGPWGEQSGRRARRVVRRRQAGSHRDGRAGATRKGAWSHEGGACRVAGGGRGGARGVTGTVDRFLNHFFECFVFVSFHVTL